MTWLQRYRFRSLLANAVWLPPLAGMVAALVALPVVRHVDAVLAVKPIVSPDGARALLAGLSSSMLTFIVFVFSILLLAVQLASAQLTPRIIARVYRNRVLKGALGIFVFAFVYTLAVLSRIDDAVPQVSMWLATGSSVVCIGIFLFMIDHVGKSLRPVSVLTAVGTSGQRVIREVFPRAIGDEPEPPTAVAHGLAGRPARTLGSRQTGVVLAFDAVGLVALARRAGGVIELVPQVGEFVAEGDPLFRLHGGDGSPADEDLHHAVAIGPERTLEQDPSFAFRIVVDIAAKALSPAINDPTTGVLAIDQVHRLLREVAGRRLDTGHVHDDAGELRLVFRTPDWEDFVGLAVTEIRHFGRDSIQIARRLRAMLESLADAVPPHRAVALRAELAILARGVDSDFRDPEDRVRASSGDSLGVGGSA